MAGSVVAQQTSPVGAPLVLPYRPSWVDRLTGWVRTLPVPGWLFYVIVGLALSLAQAVVKWYDGTLRPGEIFPLHLVLNGVTVYVVAVIPWLNDIAGKALQRARPALSVTEAEYARLHYELTNVPARAMLLASCAGALYISVLWLFFLDPALREPTRIGLTPASSVIDFVITFANVIALISFLYHTIHQLRQVRRIYASYLEVDLFQTGPLYAFSTLTARSAIALLIATYAVIGVMLTVSPALTASPAVAGVATTDCIIAALIFAWPLLDLHNRMKTAKQELLDKNASEMKTSFEEKRRRLESGEYRDMPALKDIVDTLVVERSVLEKLPVWPWQTATVRGLGTALLLPLVLWAVQRILERVLNF